MIRWKRGEYMENLWIIFVFIYSILKGTRDGMKKSALKKSSLYEVLFFYTFIGFLFALPYAKEAFALEIHLIFSIFLKSAVVCTAWGFSCLALKKISVSLYGIIDLSRMIFSTCFGVFLLKETFTLSKAVGIVIVIAGLLLANIKKDGETKNTSFIIILFAFLNCFFNALSGTMDKVLMGYMTSRQLQFWFMLFMTLIYGAVILIRREKVSIISASKNYWIPLMSLSLIIGDRLLFEANASNFSQVTLMTVIKQSSVLVSVITGWLVFKEKNILYKLICALIVMAGIFVSLS